METVRDFIASEDTDRDAEHSTDRGTPRAGQPGMDGVNEALAILREVGLTAVGDAALLGFQAASDFAGTVEELSRVMEYLQLVAAGAVDRTRQRAAASATRAGTSWTTGWRENTGPGTFTEAGAGTAGLDSVAEAAAGAVDAPAAADGPTVAVAVAEAVDDGYRNTTEFLRARLRISAAEARRRLALAGSLLPRQGFTGERLPPVHGELSAAVATGEVPSRSATIITLALDRVRHVCDAEAADRMEHALTRTAAENDPDFLTRVARSWTDALDQDGAEPSEELLRQLQGAFIRKPRHGLQHLEIFATAEQFEHLMTVMNTATNPRAAAGFTAAGTATSSTAGRVPWAEGGQDSADIPLDLRSRPQKHLDGLVSAAKVALAAGTLPAAGGLRPQVMVTIDYRDLLARLATVDGAAAPGDPMEHTGNLLFTGPVTASTVRKIACDADIIPILLGSEGRILDIGRASRVFPPHIRKALTARDLGCAFPGCTIPAPWCEAHHIDYWSRGGTTGTEKGVLLCSHHHHVIHKEHWTIQLQNGVPWFIPPPHLDPRQKPRRNSYFRPSALGPAA
ncbi:HNH endonuclease signature motif containing protein [Arthrobacter sp. U41]|uniref:HNH endonuclease signature motif containing protein n=1 Tax=Arthrobacter sp. U41 TaxID=1849032 RepID=UPI0009F4EBD9|nr:HNH endonuclease signature motif containing protein [Arthrobacter sp. U41]